MLNKILKLVLVSQILLFYCGEILGDEKEKEKRNCSISGRLINFATKEGVKGRVHLTEIGDRYIATETNEKGEFKFDKLPSGWKKIAVFPNNMDDPHFDPNRAQFEYWKSDYKVDEKWAIEDKYDGSAFKLELDLKENEHRKDILIYLYPASSVVAKVTFEDGTELDEIYRDLIEVHVRDVADGKFNGAFRGIDKNGLYRINALNGYIQNKKYVSINTAVCWTYTLKDPIEIPKSGELKLDLKVRKVRFFQNLKIRFVFKGKPVKRKDVSPLVVFPRFEDRERIISYYLYYSYGLETSTEEYSRINVLPAYREIVDNKEVVLKDDIEEVETIKDPEAEVALSFFDVLPGKYKIDITLAENFTKGSAWYVKQVIYRKSGVEITMTEEEYKSGKPKIIYLEFTDKDLERVTDFTKD